MCIQSRADSDGDGDGNGMVTVTVMVPKALSQVGWLRQRQCQSFNRLNTIYWPQFTQTQSSIGPKIPVECYSCRNAAFSSAALKQALNQALNHTLKPALKPALQRPLKMLSMSVSALSKPVGSKDWLRFIDGQPYIVP